MKKLSKKFVAVAATMLVVAGVLAFGACNKKTEMEIVANMPQNNGIIYQKTVPDRVDYIRDFEEKLKSVERSDEFLTVDNANAFLFDILNFDFCDVQYDKTDISYETSTYTLNVSNGVINLSDFATLYRQISSHIYEYYHSLNDYVNPKYYGIYPKIEAFDTDATSTTVTVKSTITSGSYQRTITFDSTLCDYFTEEEYLWDSAADTLEKYFNLQYPKCSLGNSGRVFFSGYNVVEFYYEDWYFSLVPFVSRLFYCGNCLMETYLTPEEMCVLLNNYIDLADEYALDHGGICVMEVDIVPTCGDLWKAPVSIHHVLYVTYATLCTSPIGPNL